MLSKDINQALSDLISNGNIDGNSTLGFKVVDIFPIFKHCFNDKAIKTLENKTQHLVYQYNEPIPGAGSLVLLGKLGLRSCKQFKDEQPSTMYRRSCDSVRFIASRATKDKLHVAVEKVITTVNYLAEKDFTKASMLELGVFELMPISSLDKEYVVISYITLTEKGYKYAQSYMPNMFVEEGGIPKGVDEQ